MFEHHVYLNLRDEHFSINVKHCIAGEFGGGGGWTIVRRRIKGAACVATAGSILLSQGCTFWQLVVE